MTDHYLGVWELIPELSLYEFGIAPASGTYTIEQAEDGVRLSIRWRANVDGPEQSTAFGGPTNGQAQAIPATIASAPDAFSITRIDAYTLDSSAMRAGHVVSYARRIASADGTLLAVVQQGQQPDGQRFRNFQVYRRR